MNRRPAPLEGRPWFVRMHLRSPSIRASVAPVNAAPPHTPSAPDLALVSRATLARALAASALLHALLLLALSGIVGSTPAAIAPMPALTARIVVEPTPSAEAAVATPAPIAEPSPPPEPAAPRPPVPVPSAPPLTPQPIRPPDLAHAFANVDVDGAVDELFVKQLPSIGETLHRVHFEFAEPLSMQVPERALRDQSQRRVRGLVRIHDSGQIELLVVDEYDDDLIFAIRNALDRTRARPPTDGAPVTSGWAIVVFWFERAAR